jgi:RNA polymerase sigma-70 factor (ECF subfamily)
VPAQAAVVAAVADAHRREWAAVLASTVRVTRDLDLAEECVQDAYAQALSRWPAGGVPARPGAWLTTAARNRALDLMRREKSLQRKLPLLLDRAGAEPVAGDLFGDDRLRLVFTCCHPALSAQAQVALTLRLLCGLSTAEVAHAFLVGEATMAARITRAKKKITGARIPYRIPDAEELPARVGAVLAVVHLLFTSGHTAAAGEELVRGDLLERSFDLIAMLRALLPTDADVAGLFALMLLTDSRRRTRLSPEGQLVLLEDQERARWDAPQIAEGVALVREALAPRPPGRYALMAAVAAVHAEAPTWQDTDWAQIVGLYDVLVELWPSPVVALNRAVAVGFAQGPAEALAELDRLGAEPALASYPYLAASRADMLRRLGRTSEALQAYEEALLLTENAVEREFLRDRIEVLESPT